MLSKKNLEYSLVSELRSQIEVITTPTPPPSLKVLVHQKLQNHPHLHVKIDKEALPKFITSLVWVLRVEECVSDQGEVVLEEKVEQERQKQRYSSNSDR